MRISKLSVVSAALVISLAGAADALAASNRIFLAPNGNDSSDCANPLTPCLTFAGALAQVNSGGEVIAEATGGYGPLNITKAVTISGPPGVVLYTGVQVTILAQGATVVLRGLTIDGTGASTDGINVAGVASLFIEDCVIANFGGGGTLEGTGILFASAGRLSVRDTVVRNCWSGIITLFNGGLERITVEHCRFENNTFGIFVGPAAVATVRDTTAASNSSYGFAAGDGGELNLEDCVSANNGVGVNGVFAGNTAPPLIRVSRTTITGNQTGINASFGQILSRGNNTVEGNGTDGTFSGAYSAK